MSSASKYRIIVADDHAIVRTGLKNLVDGHTSLRVVAEAEDGTDLLEKLQKVECDLVILDLSMPRLNGLDAISELRKRHPEMKILILTMHKEREFFRKALAKGVDGYVLKDDMLEKVLSAVQEIRSGRKSFSSEMTSFIAKDYAVLHESQLSTKLLTRREIDVLKLIASGKMNKEIAADLKIGVRTVETHRSNIMEKLSIRNVAGLTKFAISHGLI